MTRRDSLPRVGARIAYDLVSEFTHAAVRGVIEGERIGSVTVKGRAEPVVIYAIPVPEATATTSG